MSTAVLDGVSFPPHVLRLVTLSLLQSSLPRRYVEHSLYEGTVFSSLEVYPKRAQRTLRLDGSDSILETTVHFYSYARHKPLQMGNHGRV